MLIIKKSSSNSKQLRPEDRLKDSKLQQNEVTTSALYRPLVKTTSPTQYSGLFKYSNGIDYSRIVRNTPSPGEGETRSSLLQTRTKNPAFNQNIASSTINKNTISNANDNMIRYGNMHHISKPTYTIDSERRILNESSYDKDSRTASNMSNSVVRSDKANDRNSQHRPPSGAKTRIIVDASLTSSDEKKSDKSHHITTITSAYNNSSRSTLR